MSEYDHASKIAARAIDSEGFLRWLLPKVMAEYDYFRWLPTETIAMPGEPGRHCDTVVSLSHREGTRPWLAEVIEVQSSPRFTLARLAEYGLRIHREVLLQRDPNVAYSVRLAVVHLTGPEQSAIFRMGETGNLPAALQVQADVVTIADKDAAATVESVATGNVSRAVLSLVPLMRGADAATVVDRWKVVAADFPDRTTIGFLALTFARLKPWSDLWADKLRGWGVEESPYWREIREEARGEGRVEGRVEGQVIQARQVLLRFVGRRFGEAIQNELRPRIDRSMSIPELERCLDLVLVDKLDEIRQVLPSVE